MRIGFVAEPYEETNASGMGYVVIEFLRHFPLRDADTLTIYSSRPINKELIRTPHTNVIVSKGILGKLWYFARLRNQVDVLLFVSPLLPLWLPRSVKTVVICQELASQKTPVEGLRDRLLALFRDHLLMTACLARASVVIAASGATKKDIHEFYTVPDKKVVVIYDGYQDLRVYEKSAPPVDIPKPFFFFAGKVKPRKNVHSIVSAFISFKKRLASPAKLVIAGDYGGVYYNTIMEEVEQNDMNDDVLFVGYTTGARLYSFYTNALALVFPSFNEGFGMPPVEAMSLGLPVITSNISSMAEVVSDAGLLIDPYNTEDISRAMELIYSDEKIRRELIERGLRRSREFSWQKSADELMAVIVRL